MASTPIRPSGPHRTGRFSQPPADSSFYRQYLHASPLLSRVTDLAEKARAVNPRLDLDRFFEAAGVCLYAHRNQTRKISGDLYAVHPIGSAEKEVILFKVGDENELIAALLHDVVEDTAFDLLFVRQRFGPDVARLVDGMTKIEQLGKDHYINEHNIDKFIFAMAADIRLLRLKTVDRICNLEDADKLPRENRERNCREALDFYVPLLWLCGQMKPARHLSDLALRKLDPAHYAEVKKRIETVLWQNRNEIKQLKSEIAGRFQEKITNGLPAELLATPQGRRYLEAKIGGLKINAKPNSVYKADQTAALRGTEVRNLSDIMMLQIVVETEEDCYQMTNVVHSLGIPMDRYWHDYIKDPKINGYQSIHTAILRGETLFRFQIRTREMQAQSQEGVLYNAYAPNGEFRQPNIPWLRTDWLKLLFAVHDRRDKVVMVKALAQAKVTSLMVRANGEIKHYEALLPHGVTPLEAAFIADPELGMTVVGATHQDTSWDINKPLEGSVGILRLRAAGEPQARDYMSLLTMPLARLRFVDFMASKSEEARFKFAGNSLDQALGKYFLRLDELLRECPKLVNATIAKIVAGEIAAAGGAQELNAAVQKADDGSLMIARLTFEARQANASALLTGLNEAFPVESGGFFSDRVKVSIPVKHKLIGNQLERAVRELERNNDAVITAHDIILPPLIQDPAVLNPNSFNYSRDLALRASRALRSQKGIVFDMFLNPLAMSMIPGNFAGQVADVLADHISSANLLLIGGNRDDISLFYQRIAEYLAIKSAPEPLVVLYERDQMFQSEGIIQPLTQLEEPYFGYTLTELGHIDEFIFQKLLFRFDQASRSVRNF
ncbi:MAG: HD domain-containing protein [Candidatus Margulisiibacteriota bacterium]